MSARAIPDVGRITPPKVPAYAQRKLRNGLEVLAVRRPTVPRIEMHLRIPAGAVWDPGDESRALLLSETLLTGTSERSAVDIAMELQRLGASLGAGTDADDLLVRGGTLAGSFDRFLGLVCEVLVDPAFPAREVEIARERLAQDIVIRRSEPQSIAKEISAARVYGRHRYGRPSPEPDRVRRVGRAPIARFHNEHAGPAGARMVLVGDLRPEQALDRVEAALGRWKRRPKRDAPPPPGAPPAGMPMLVVDRPGSVQTSIRLAGPAVARTHPDATATQLANLVFGGYFTSRLVTNIREQKGYTYSPGSMIVHHRLDSLFVVVADVGTEVTAPAMVEIAYELGRMSTLPVSADELEAAKRYLAGNVSLQLATQAGLASYLDAIGVSGLGPDYLREFTSRLAHAGVGEIAAASERLLAARALNAVLVGDAARIARSLETLGPVEVRTP